MGSKIKNLASKTEENVELIRGKSHNILNEFNDIMDNVVKKMVNLINKQLPISDDLLLACWKFEEMKKNDKKDTNNNDSKSIYITDKKQEEEENTSNNRIWECLKKQIINVLKEPKNKFQWYWLELYILDSVVK